LTPPPLQGPRLSANADYAALPHPNPVSGEERPALFKPSRGMADPARLKGRGSWFGSLQSG